MRTPIIAGNWKMHKTLTESVAFAKELAPKLAPYSEVEKLICPSFISVAAVSEAVRNTDLMVGAQDVHFEEQGAYTSEVSPLMLMGLVEYVIIGHSECRAYLNDTDERVNKKVKAALAHHLKPILAVGESLEQNEAGETEAFVSGQIRAGLEGVCAEQMASVVIAYEPIWAIGTGKSASGELANEIIHTAIRKTLKALYGDTVAENTRIQYGGSVKPGNMMEYMSQPDIDGALVGGAALDIDNFVDLVRIAAEAKGK
ncbi:triose-phosphate isomerase [Anaerolineales bacterium]